MLGCDYMKQLGNVAEVVCPIFEMNGVLSQTRYGWND